MKLKQQEINRIFEDLSEKLCKNCSNCNICWEKNFQRDYQAACNLFEAAERDLFKRGYRVFLADCICVDEFIKETNRGFEIAKLNYIWHNRIAESREVIAEQLKVSSVIQDITGEIYEGTLVAKAEEEKVIRRLKAEHVLIKEITIMERETSEIYLTAACRKGTCMTAKRQPPSWRSPRNTLYGFRSL